MILNIISLYLFIAILLSMYLGAFVQSRNGASYTKGILFLSIAVSIYMLGYAFELNATTYEMVLLWNKIEYFGIPFVSALWLTVALMYTGHFFPVRKWMLAAVFVIPIITFIARFTNEFHDLYFASTSYIYDNHRILLVKEMGPLMYLQLFHSMGMIFISLVLFITAFIKKRDIKGPKIRLMVIASFFAVAGLFMNTINPFELNIDYMVIFLPITCIMVIISILKYDFLEIKTIARDMVFEKSSDLILLLNYNNALVDYNQSAKQFFNGIGIELREDSLDEIVVECEHNLDALMGEETATFQIIDSNETKYYRVTTEQIGDLSSASRGMMKIIQDTTEFYEMNAILRKQANIDELSHTLNRRPFMEKGKTVFDDQRHCDISLLMMDVDNFKSINDGYGHAAGDEVIRVFGRLLNDSFREEDTIARLGGEEFAVLMKNITIESVYERAEAFRKSVANYQYAVGENKFSVTVSIGVAQGGNHVETFDELLNNADIAMYQAKANGRNQVV